MVCPSAPAKVGATILGIVSADGSISYLKDSVVATDEFITTVGASGTPETRFRFSSHCEEGGCKQWLDGRCTVPERAAEFLPVPDDATLPRCSIRARCRWFAQSGRDACTICPLIVTTSTAAQSAAE